jgi:hypothetical protein
MVRYSQRDELEIVGYPEIFPSCLGSARPQNPVHLRDVGAVSPGRLRVEGRPITSGQL